MPLRGFQRKYLRGLAHHLKPVVMVGHQGLTEGVFEAIDTALDDHELIKVRFQDHKAEKHELAGTIASTAKAELVGLLGNTAILYRSHSDPDRRRIDLPDERTGL